jgi:hypothetical protein
MTAGCRKQLGPPNPQPPLVPKQPNVELGVSTNPATPASSRGSTPVSSWAAHTPECVTDSRHCGTAPHVKLRRVDLRNLAGQYINCEAETIAGAAEVLSRTRSKTLHLPTAFNTKHYCRDAPPAAPARTGASGGARCAPKVRKRRRRRRYPPAWLVARTASTGGTSCAR